MLPFLVPRAHLEGSMCASSSVHSFQVGTPPNPPWETYCFKKIKNIRRSSFRDSVMAEDGFDPLSVLDMVMFRALLCAPFFTPCYHDEIFLSTSSREFLPFTAWQAY